MNRSEIELVQKVFTRYYKIQLSNSATYYFIPESKYFYGQIAFLSNYRDISETIELDINKSRNKKR